MLMSRKRIVGFFAAAAVPLCCAVSITGTAQADNWGLAQAQAAGIAVDPASALVVASAPANTCLGDPVMQGCPTITAITNADPALTMAEMSPSYDMDSNSDNASVDALAPDDDPNVVRFSDCGLAATPAPYLTPAPNTPVTSGSSGGASIGGPNEALSTGHIQCYDSNVVADGMYVVMRTNQGGFTNEIISGNVTNTTTPQNEVTDTTESLCSNGTKGTPPYDTLLDGEEIPKSTTTAITATAMSVPSDLACNFVNQGSSSGGAGL